MTDLFDSRAPLDSAPNDDERRALVALSLVPGVGPTRVRALLAALGRASTVMRAPLGQLTRVDGVGRQTARAIRAWNEPAEVDRQLACADAVGARLVALADDEYPALLREIYDPPPFLWVRGRITDADAGAVAVVGTRRASDYGCRAAQSFAGDLAGASVTVVSGLAYGIDVAAHRAALAAGGRTVAVLGSGVDHIYPSRHAPVVREILERDLGAVVSELPLGATPDAPNFPRRNRIVSGMSVATIVAEAHERGGALLTAAIALEQNREVFAVPASVFAPATGTNRMIRRGLATLAARAGDVLETIAPQTAAGAAPSDSAVDTASLTAVERRLMDALGAEPVPLDTVCAQARVDASTALVYLLQLEFRGLVRQLAGKQFFRA